MHGQRSHIRIEFNDTAFNVTISNVVQWYAADEETLSKAQLWATQQQPTPTARELANWLGRNGAVLDCENGPAFIQTYNNGSRYQVWCREGKAIKSENVAGLPAIQGVTLYPPPAP